MPAIPEQLRRRLVRAIRACPADGILLSGGLDTSVIAWLASGHISGFVSRRGGPLGPPVGRPEGRPLQVGRIAITVRVVGARAPDLPYAVALAKRLGLQHHILSVSRPALLRALVPSIRILKSFDPMEIRNSVAAYLGLQEARRLGVRSVHTGDGGDEVFCGYSFLFGKSSAELKTYQKRLFGFMRFSSVPLGRALGVRVESPFLDRGLMRMALKLPRRWLIQTRHGTPIGKWAVRKALEGDLPDRFVWREKLPIEYGSGTTILRRWLSEPADRRAFARAKPAVLKRDGIRLRDPEQWHYYLIYRRFFGPPRPARAGAPACVACRTRLNHPESRFCTTCGEWPANGGQA